MTDADIKRLIGMALGAFPSYQERDMRPTAILWSKVFADISYPIAEAALVKVLTTAKYWPTPADIREAALLLTKKNGPPAAADAWLEVLEKLNPHLRPAWSHPLIGKAVQALGYVALCVSETPAIDRAHFLRIYGQLLEREKDDEQNLVVIRLIGGTLELTGGAS